MTKRDEQRLLPYAEALRAWRAALESAGCPDRLPPEKVALPEAVGRVPAAIVRTKNPSPAYRAAAMDGYAVRSEGLESASLDNPIRLQIGVSAVPLDTGGAVPDGFDAVVAAENVRVQNGDVDVLRATHANKNVRLPGDDVPPGVAVGWPGTALRAVECSALLASGCTTVDVVKRPRLGVIPTGNEVVPPGVKPSPGMIIDSNSPMIAAEARSGGADVRVWPIIKDDDAALEAALREAVGSSDAVVVLGGSSAGRRDRGCAAIERVGVIDVRGVATRPARPVTLGHAGAVPIVNLPGYPVSCHFAFETYVAPLLRRLAGLADPPPRRARLAESLAADPELDEWRLASLLTAPGSPRAVVVPLEEIGGGLYRLTQADARFHLKREIGRFGRYAAVGWTPLREADVASRALFVGPYDPLVEEMAALGGFRCRFTDDETGEALDAGLADAVGVIVRGTHVETLRKRAGEGRKMLPIGKRSEGYCKSRTAGGGDGPAMNGEKSGNQLGDPWAGAAAVAAGMRSAARCTRYVAERYDLLFEEGEPALYAIVWEDRPGHRFPWGIILAAALSALATASTALGWKNIGLSAEVMQ